jgi:hypothetical protein
MAILVRTALVVGLVLLVPAAAWVYGTVERPASTTGTVAPATSPPSSPGGLPRPMGSASCAAAACHGGSPATSLTAPPGPTCWQTSATHWMAADPHTKAYAALKGELARKIVIHLWGANPDGSPKFPATEDSRCVACHTNPALVDPVVDLSPTFGVEHARRVALREEGVGCEACHGNASSWYGPHTTWNPGTRASGYRDHKMPKLYDVGERALICAGCHVGAPADDALPEEERRGYPVARDMNHDMIAAGHPRLNFDFADYQNRLPPHWQEKDRVGTAPRGPAFEVKAWLVGRVATAEAACRLTADRARRANASPWPEFAEFNCYSCHHDLVPGGWKQQHVAHGSVRRPGSPPWQTIWPVTRTDALAEVSAVTAPAAVADMKGLLAAIEVPRPAVAPVRDAAAKAAGSLMVLRRELVGLPDAAAGTAALKAFDPLRSGAGGLDWDTAAQAYLGAAAVERARLRREPDAKESPAFRAALEPLKLPRRFKKGETEEKFNSPRDLDPAATRESLKGVLEAVPRDWPR